MITRESLGPPSLIVDADCQKLQNDQSISFSHLNYQSVMAELEKLLQEELPSLNGEALNQEGRRLYLQIESALPYDHYQKVEIPSELIRSLVLHALRKSGNSLGVQNQDDIYISEWLNCLEKSNVKPQTVDFHDVLQNLRKLSRKCGVRYLRFISRKDKTKEITNDIEAIKTA